MLKLITFARSEGSLIKKNICPTLLYALSVENSTIMARIEEVMVVLDLKAKGCEVD